MINRITKNIYIPPIITNRINSLKPFAGGSWDIKKKEITIFKRLLKKELLLAQKNCCAYCGLPLDETGKTEIEHLAPKGGPVRPKHVEFTFEVENLYLSCNLCNSPSKKGFKDTVLTKDPLVYSNCSFKIVHPRYDIPSDHYEWVIDTEEVLIQSDTLKGKASIKMFLLDSTAHNEARARIEMSRRLRLLSDPDDLLLIRAILNYN